MQPPSKPVVIAHRGASGYRPEHTLAAYALAGYMGADFLEPDLVMTRDGHLVCRHEPEIGGTTDVAHREEFADRFTTKSVDGTEVEGWFAEDFSLAELRTLRATERIPDVRPGNTAYDRAWPIPTLQEVIDLSKGLSHRLGRPVGIYPETKHPTYFRAQDRPLEAPLIEALRANDLHRADSPIFIQSFETTNLKRMRVQLRAPVIQLIGAPDDQPYDLRARGESMTYGDMTTPEGLEEIARGAAGIGVPKSQLTPELIHDAHAAGLLVHPYTYRRENQFLPSPWRKGRRQAGPGDLVGELRGIIDLGVDGYFTDNPDLGVLARDGEGA